MSEPHAAPVSASPSPGSARGSRGPWIVSAVAVVVAVAALVALVVVVVSRDGDRAGRGPDRGFASPEEAVTFLVDRLADGRAAEASEAFAVDAVVDGYSFEAELERLQAYTPQAWLPASSAAFAEIDEGMRRGDVAGQLRILVRSVLTPDRDQTQSVALDDDVTAEVLAGELDPDALAELSVARVDEVERAEAAYDDNLAAQAEIYAADELRMVAVLLDTAEGRAMGGVTVVRYGDEWSILSLSAPILSLPYGQLVAATEQDYLDAVAEAEGAD